MKALYHSLRALVGMSVLLAFAGAHAADGITVKVEQESLIKPGMSREEVRGLLGKPSTNVKYPNEPGRTWTYNVAGKIEQRVVFDVDFTSDGKVTSSKERTLPMGEGGSH